jgi:hypothetical protein
MQLIGSAVLVRSRLGVDVASGRVNLTDEGQAMFLQQRCEEVLVLPPGEGDGFDAVEALRLEARKERVPLRWVVRLGHAPQTFGQVQRWRHAMGGAMAQRGRSIFELDSLGSNLLESFPIEGALVVSLSR